MPLAVCGIDLSSNKFGLVLLDATDGDIIDWKYASPVQKNCAFFPKNSVKMPSRPSDTRMTPVFNMERMLKIITFYTDWFLQWQNYYSIIANIEDYAYGIARSGKGNTPASRSLTGLAEIAGSVKLMMYNFDIPYRLTDPKSLKMWLGNGNYKKIDIYEVSKEKKTIMLDFLNDSAFFGVNKSKKKVFKEALPGCDVMDAYWLADILRHEVLVRKGIYNLVSLEPTQRKLFLRVTTVNPVNILDKPFVASSEKMRDI